MKACQGIIALCLAALLCCTACGTTAPTDTTASQATEPPVETPTKAPAEAPTEEPAEKPAEPETGTLHHVEITVENYGTIKLELDAGQAPITVENFLKLAGEGFYDGLTFHRIIDGFMIQGGDPLGNGTGGSGTNIKGEFALNGVENNISHTAGVISMARAKNPDSASSQFFITVADATFLDGQYAAFGWVQDAESLALVQKIAADARPIDNNGTIPAAEQPVISGITVVD